jgi:hypothetical protein
MIGGLSLNELTRRGSRVNQHGTEDERARVSP